MHTITFTLRPCLRCGLFILRGLTQLVSYVFMYMLNIYRSHTYKFIQTYSCYILLLLLQSLLLFLWFAIDKYSNVAHLYALTLHFHTLQHSHYVTMVLQLNNGHVICHDIDVTWSVGLAWTYFGHPDNLAIQGWIHTPFYIQTLLSRQDHMFTNMLSFSGGGGAHTSGYPM